MIWRNLWRRRARSLLTILGIAIGVAAVIALGAMADGIAEGYAAFAGGSGADLLVTQADAVDLTVSSVDEQVGQRILQLAGVRDVSGVIFNVVQLEGIPYFSVGGYDPHGVAIQHFKIIQGDSLAGEKQLLLGRHAAANVHLHVDRRRLDALEGHRIDMRDHVRPRLPPYRIMGQGG